jgi:hypothetical protein
LSFKKRCDSQALWLRCIKEKETFRQAKKVKKEDEAILKGKFT